MQCRYAPTETCDSEEKEMFYLKLDSVLEQCPCRDALIVLSDFKAVTGTGRAGCKSCVGLCGSSIKTNKSSFLLNLARLRHALTQHEYLALLVPVEMDEDSDLQVAGDPCLTLWL